jgi:hypothetical protein
MTAEQPHPENGTPRCQDCGRPFAAGTGTDAAGEPFRVCRACYDVYVDHAGHWPVKATPPAS